MRVKDIKYLLAVIVILGGVAIVNARNLKESSPPETITMLKNEFYSCENKWNFGYIYGGEAQRGHYFLVYSKVSSSEVYQLPEVFIRINAPDGNDGNFYYRYYIEYIDDSKLVLRLGDN